jgi:hypothetical protein
MAEVKVQRWMTPAAFYGIVAQIYLSMYFVLMASAKPEDHWFRIFVMFYLILLAFLWAGVSLWFRFAQRTSQEATVHVQGNIPTDEGPK